MKVMEFIKVVDFIKKLKELGYDENTQLMFDVVDEYGDSHELKIENFLLADEVTGDILDNIIDVELKVPSTLITSLVDTKFNNMEDNLIEKINKFETELLYIVRNRTEEE